jgi:hypothetical protein
MQKVRFGTVGYGTRKCSVRENIDERIVSGQADKCMILWAFRQT